MGSTIIQNLQKIVRENHENTRKIHLKGAFQVNGLNPKRLIINIR